MIRKFVTVLILILAFSYANTSLFAMKSSISFSGAPLFILGDDAEYFDTGYSLSPGYEMRFNKHFGLEFNPALAYVYYENRIPGVSIFVDNDILSFNINPKFYAPFANDKLEFVVGPLLGYGNVKSTAKIFIFDPYSMSYIRIEEDHEKDLFSFGLEAGFNLNLNEHWGLQLSGNWNNMDLGHDMNELSFQRDDANAVTEIETTVVNANLKIKYTF